MNVEKELEKLADKLGESIEDLRTEFSEIVEEYLSYGMDEDKATKFGLKALKGRYQAQLRSNAVPVVGYFFALTPVTNVTAMVYEEAVDRIEEYKEKYGDEWLERAIEDEIVNEKGEPIYNSGNTSEAQSWMRGRPIPPKRLERMGYGIFEVKGVKKLGVVYIRDVEKIKPEFLKLYKFRATVNDNGYIFSISTTKVTKLKEIGEVSFEEFESDLGEYAEKNLHSFEEIYDLENKEVKLNPEAPRIAIAQVIITRINELDEYDVNFVDLTDLNSEEFDLTSFVIDKEIYEISDAIEEMPAIAVFRPYFNKNGEPSGNLFSLIIDRKLKVKPKPIPEDDFDFEEEDVDLNEIKEGLEETEELDELDELEDDWE